MRLTNGLVVLSMRRLWEARMRGLLIVLALVALIGGGGYAVREYAPQYLPDEWTTDAVLTQRLREDMRDDPRADAFFTKFEQLFPADYNELMSQVVALHRRNGTEQQGFTLGQTYLRSFIDDNQMHIAGAEPAVLTKLGRAISHGTTLLREEDAELCGNAFREGRGFSVETEGMSAATQDAFLQIALAMLDGIASGKRTQTVYVQPSDAQWAALVGRYEALGGDAVALQASASPVQMRMLPAATMCGMVERVWVAALQAEDDFFPRFVSYSMRQAG
jgi:hypothetical protein